MTQLSATATVPRLALHRETVRGLLTGQGSEHKGAAAKKTNANTCTCYTCAVQPTCYTCFCTGNHCTPW